MPSNPPPTRPGLDPARLQRTLAVGACLLHLDGSLHSIHATEKEREKFSLPEEIPGSPEGSSGPFLRQKVPEGSV